MSARQEAARLAQAGFRIVPLWPLGWDEETGERICTCSNPSAHKPSNSGKHAHGRLAPHGVKDATNDVSEIEEWPEVNIGLALTDTLIAIDFDVPEMAAALADPDLGLRDEACFVRTGRGLHAYVICAPTTTGNMKDAQGRALGEVRASGSYTVLPPSEHILGRYEWVGPDLTQHIPHWQGDGWSYAKHLLSMIGVELTERTTSMAVEGGGRIEPCDLPFEPPLEAMLLRQLLSGTYPTDDRSEALYRLACEAYRQARVVAVVLDARTVAGVVKKVDAIAYRKFVSRADGDVRLYELAVRAKADVDAEPMPDASLTLVAVPATDADVDAQKQADAQTQRQAMQTYAWDENAQEFIDRSGRAPKRISTFEARIVEQLIVQEPDEAESHVDWLMTLRRRDDTRSVRVATEVWADASKLSKFIDAATPSSWIIEDQMFGKFKVGVQHFSGDVPTRHAYTYTGWLVDRDAYVLPGTRGAITADGWDENIVYEGELAHTPRIVDEQADLAELVRMFIEPGSVPARVAVALMTQILASPLASLGFSPRTWMHVYGPTNSLKTSYTKALMALYGYSPKAEDMGLHNWTGTTNHIRKMTYVFRDLPILFDDYKTSLISDRDLTGLIQNYGDGSGRGRLTSDLRTRRTDVPRGLAISTGEDIWHHQRSSLTRTMEVQMLPDQAQKEWLTRLQLAAIGGKLGGLGVAWLRWLCGRGKKYLTAYMSDGVQELRPRVAQYIGDDHPRIVDSYAALFNVQRLFQNFLTERVPEVVDAYREWSNVGWLGRIQAAAEQAEEGVRIAALNQIIETIAEHVMANNVYIAGRLQQDFGNGLGLQGMPIVAFIDDDKLYLAEHVTLGWYSKLKRSEGHEVGFSWAQVVNDAKSIYQVDGPRQARAAGVEHGLRLLALPRSILDDLLHLVNVVMPSFELKPE